MWSSWFRENGLNSHAGIKMAADAECHELRLPATQASSNLLHDHNVYSGNSVLASIMHPDFSGPLLKLHVSMFPFSLASMSCLALSSPNAWLLDSLAGAPRSPGSASSKSPIAPGNTHTFLSSVLPSCAVPQGHCPPPPLPPRMFLPVHRSRTKVSGMVILGALVLVPPEPLAGLNLEGFMEHPVPTKRSCQRPAGYTGQ